MMGRYGCETYCMRCIYESQEENQLPHRCKVERRTLRVLRAKERRRVAGRVDSKWSGVSGDGLRQQCKLYLVESYAATKEELPEAVGEIS